MTSALNGVSGSLALIGDAGVGKSALLDDLARSASTRARVVRIVGVEPEAELSFSGVHRALLAFPDAVDGLPPAQRDALAVALGRTPGDAPDRFLVGLATLSVLARVAEDGPLLVCVDDVHWLDVESLDVLAFAARRLKAEGIAMAFASRPDEASAGRLTGIARLELGGLDPEPATELLRRALGSELEPLAAAQVVRATGGNPLALIDLGAELSTQSLAGYPLLAEPVPVGRHLEDHYAARAAALPPATGRWLVVAAAEATGATGLVAAAADALGLPAEAHEPAEAAGLVDVGATVAFRHPLVRSAVYGAATPSERRRAHRALADASPGAADADLRAWHRAAAQVAPDEAVAAHLEQAATRAAERGGVASGARLLARAVELTPAGTERDRRILAAAEASAAAGAARAALALLGRLDPDALDPVARGRYIFTRATSAPLLGEPAAIRRAAADALAAADAFHGRAPELERTALLRAFDFALTAEFLVEATTLGEIGERCLLAAGDGDEPDAIVLRAIGTFITRPYAEAVPALRRAADLFDDLPPGLALRFGQCSIAIHSGLWDERGRERALRRAARIARDTGALAELDTLLWILALCLTEQGRLSDAGDLIGQVRRLRAAIGYSAEQVENAEYLGLVAADGSRESITAVADWIHAAGFGGAHSVAMMGLTLLDLADGRWAEAADRLEPMIARDFIQVTMHQLPDYAEAASRAGRADASRRAAVALAEYADANGSPWAAGVAARALALGADDAEAEAGYLRAIGWLEQSDAPLDLARTHLLYGEWLRRMRRRRDARTHLRLALSAFESIGAPAFAARARRELAASGDPDAGAAPSSEAPGAPGARVRDGLELTAQEAAVARLAAAGRTNAEIAARLYVSPNTVDYHLRKVFRILGVTSRRQLAAHLDDAQA